MTAVEAAGDREGRARLGQTHLSGEPGRGPVAKDSRPRLPRHALLGDRRHPLSWNYPLFHNLDCHLAIIVHHLTFQ